MVKTELVFIPAPLVGHFISTIEIAKLLIEHDSRLSVTVLIIKLPFPTTTNQLLANYSTTITDQTRLRFADILPNHSDPVSESQGKNFQFIPFIESLKPHVKEVVSELTRSGSGHDPERKLAGFVVDMVCTSMIDVANELGVPAYLFFTSSASYLGLMFHLLSLHTEQNVDIATEFKDPNTELSVPYFVNPVPAKVLPYTLWDKDGGWSAAFLDITRGFREAKGIMVNAFTELESHAINSFSYCTTKTLTPRVYPVGPILNLNGIGGTQRHEEEEDAIMKWLDDQPPSSVVFLCFGSRGCFGPAQVREIAHGLECSGYRFLWSLRKPPPTDQRPSPTDYTNPEEVLPDGFMERICIGLGIGKIIGWAPQVKILAHQAIGGFISHCGWNSILESLWFGVPVATWPMYAEQQVNAFHMVRELGLAVEIKLDYNKDTPDVEVVDASDIERGIRCVMEQDSEVRKKVEEVREKSRNSMMVGGSSYASLGRFIEDVIHNGS